MTENSPVRLGDLVKWETRREFCREQVTITTGADITLDEGMGYPVVAASNGTATLIVVATDATTNALLLEPGEITFLNGVAKTVTILRRGPALVNVDKIIVTDHADAAMTLGDITGGLADEGIQLYESPAETNEQTA